MQYAGNMVYLPVSSKVSFFQIQSHMTEKYISFNITKIKLTLLADSKFKFVK